jgi:hypothetical protein
MFFKKLVRGILIGQRWYVVPITTDNTGIKKWLKSASRFLLYQQVNLQYK